jgi:hypothetical protein
VFLDRTDPQSFLSEAGFAEKAHCWLVVREATAFDPLQALLSRLVEYSTNELYPIPRR